MLQISQDGELKHVMELNCILEPKWFSESTHFTQYFSTNLSFFQLENTQVCSQWSCDGSRDVFDSDPHVEPQFGGTWFPHFNREENSPNGEPAIFQTSFMSAFGDSDPPVPIFQGWNISTGMSCWYLVSGL